MKTPRQLERYCKGVANHRRIAILELVAKEKDLSVEDIAQMLQGNIKTISQHIKVLLNAGLINKRYQGRNVVHSLSPYGERFIKFLKTF